MSSSSSDGSSNNTSSWFSKLLLRDVINNKLTGVEPWKIVLGTAVGVLGAKACYTLYHTENRWQSIGGSALATIRQLPGAKQVVSSQTSKILVEMEAGVTLKDCGEPNLVIPADPVPYEELLARMGGLIDRESKKWRDGKVSGVVYFGNDEHTRFVNEAFVLYSLSNPLHADLFPSLRKFESEVIAMTISMLGGSPSTHFGAVTSGGTESIIMALKCYRDLARKEKPHIVAPEVIACVTAHAAFKKGCQYFDLKLIEVPTGEDHRMSLRHVAEAITPNTILLVGSAPCYSSGMIDPIPELGQLALRHQIGLHVDGCLGGFILPWIKNVNPDMPPFDLSVPGVTSMSADTHKYGYTVKGTSVLTFSTKKLRDCMHFVDTDWPGGIYASPGMAGSRSGGLIAATWASLMGMGRSRFQQVANGIWETVQEIKAGIRNTPPLQLLGDSQSSVVAFHSDSLNIFRVGEGMSKRGWALNNLQRPNAIHVCVVGPMIGKGALFIQELQEVVREIVASSDAHSGGSAGIYGLATSIPDRSIIRDIAAGYLDILGKPMTPAFAASSSH